MGQIFIVRHGETVWNREGHIQGHTDVALSPRGIEQATQLAERLKYVSFDAAYASDLCRASETAAVILRGRDVPLYPTAKLREYHKGAFEGMTDSELRARFPGTAVVVVVLCNRGTGGYLLPRDEYGKGLYQEEAAVIGPGGLEEVTETIVRQMKSWGLK